MKISTVIQYASRISAVCALGAILTSCSASSTALSADSALVTLSPSTAFRINSVERRQGYMGAHSDRRRSWMARGTGSMNLLYISDVTAGDLYVYSYPKAKLEGVVTGLSDPEGVCVDNSGDVWVANTSAQDVVEYAHGGTAPIATLSDSGYYPLGCAVDPTTGNLAVTNICEEAYGQCVGNGNVLVFPDAENPPASYSDAALTQPFFCGYDNKGNLYVDGEYNDTSFAFAELRSGRSSFTNVTLDETIYQPGGVQWDGKYVAVGDEELYNNLVLEFKIKGTQGKLARPGGTPLDGATQIVQFWIAGNVIVGPNHGGSGSVMFWRYPAGGSPFKTINAFTTPIGATISMAKS
jgi:DNA-binding beta-propeller fold protein YncE